MDYGIKNNIQTNEKLIAELPTLTAPAKNDELIVYLATAEEVVSAVLMMEREGKQMPIYFVSRALHDFIVERPEDDSLATPMDVDEKLPDPWTLFTDGSSCIDGSRPGLLFTNPKRMKFTYALRFRFNATNNEAEYEALIAGLMIAEKMGIKNLQTNVDSRLVANQVPRCENKMADTLSKIASTSFAHLTKQVRVEELNEKSINEAEVLTVVEEEGDT
ncbi:reverse transcriptase domain-containing protein [Tanacetum coccineum]